MNALDEIFLQSSTENEYFRNYADYLSKLLAQLDTNAVKNVMNVFLKAREENKMIYFAGNGGSASTASHFAQDMSEVGRKIKGKGFKTQSINDNVAALTAISNDYDYASVFSMQIQYNFEPGDVLVVISASGNSKNVLNAVNLAKEKGGTTVGLVGFSGGKLKEIVDHLIYIPSRLGEYGPIEDLHLVINHMIVSYLMTALKKETA